MKFHAGIHSNFIICKHVASKYGILSNCSQIHTNLLADVAISHFLPSLNATSINTASALTMTPQPQTSTDDFTSTSTTQKTQCPPTQGIYF